MKIKSSVVRLKIRVRLPDGSYPFVEPVFASNGKLKPLYAVVGGKQEHHPEGVYHLRYLSGGKRVWDSVGADPQLALTAKLQRERQLGAEAAGIAVVEHAPERKGRTPLNEAIENYVSEVKAQKSRKTHLAYALTLKLFGESCQKLHLEDLDRKVVIAYMGHLKSKGCGPRTVANRIGFLKTFFRSQSLPWPLAKSDRPRYTEKVVSAYSKDEIRRLMTAANQDEYELFQFFLCTGAREQEVEYATWRDVDLNQKTFAVTEKLDFGFVPKDKEEGIIPIPDSLVELLRARKQRRPDTRLIFPGSNGKPDGHFLRILKRLALRAGMNCGQCYNRLGKCCADHFTCRRWELHRFRKTYATMHHEGGVSVRTIQRWLRHSDLETTLRYLAGSDDTSERTRQQVNATFAGLAGPCALSA
jgi:integrase/recombinase XerD